MIATTHSELATRCRKLGIETRTIHNSSILTALAGEIGLHAYSFGKPVTITRGPPASMATVYSTLHSNLTRYLHTVLLIEYDLDSDYFVPPNEAITSLLETAIDGEHLRMIPLSSWLLGWAGLIRPSQPGRHSALVKHLSGHLHIQLLFREGCTSRRPRQYRQLPASSLKL